ncbi:MAG TPA: hypothetical protein VFN03_00885, partial [Trueperaceae bacterium]|nr:hypothetical protein [Trueperaceae bacterium]
MSVRFGDLHDLFATSDGARIRTPAQWESARGPLVERVVDLMYGGMPPAPDGVEVSLRSQGRARRLAGEPV